MRVFFKKKKMCLIAPLNSLKDYSEDERKKKSEG